MNPLSTQDVLSDIEFELAQGAVSRDDLGQGIQAVRQFQAKTRAEIFANKAPTLDQRQVVGRQFQVLEMQTTLLQETAAALHAVQLDLRRTNQALARRPQAASLGLTSIADHPVAGAAPDEAFDLWPTEVAAPAAFAPERTEAVTRAMQPEALQIQVEARAVKIPLIGGLLQRLRVGMHSLAWFYAHQLGVRQSPINQVYGEELLQLMSLANQQQHQIAHLSAQVAQLQARLAARDTTDRAT
jgi:hypothetical protein